MAGKRKSPQFFNIFSILIILLNSLLSLTEAVLDDALVTRLPGFDGKFQSNHYSGYVTLDKVHGKKLFYYFVESERNPASDPLVLWLNGGPGCSSLDGFVYEHGPFNFEMRSIKGGLPKLHLNPFSWSKVSNIIYLDSPAGVGFSYSQKDSDYTTGDLQTAYDTHIFLLKWFELYKEFLTNPFFIAGESYAGIYVPTLASEVVKGIEAGVKPAINFKGYIVGNGVTDDLFDGNALVPFAHGMGLISDELFQEATTACVGNFYNHSTVNCTESLNKIDQTVEDLNIYNILEPCYHGGGILETVTSENQHPISFRKLGETERPLPVRKRMFGRAWPFRAPVKDGIVPLWPQILNGQHVPCINDEVASVWLNDASVRKAIHADPTSVAGSWELCTDRIQFTHDSGSMIKYHKSLTSKGYRALIYSGDHDMCVPFTGTKEWTKSIGYKIVDKWRPWSSNGQVAGYLQGYDNNLTFLTVKGSGHTVPEYKPREALDFYRRWVSGKTI